MVTPACDLANRKAETIVYLPVVPVRAFFCTRAVLPDIRDRLAGLIQAGKFDPKLEWPVGRFRSPSRQDIATFKDAITAHLSAVQRGLKEVGALRRVIAGLEIVDQIAAGALSQISSATLSEFFGSDWDKAKENIVKNSYRSDIHFLPKDDQPSGFIALENHSVVLFRYPITIPIEILDLAQHTPEEYWKEACSALERVYPSARAFVPTRPVKVLSVKNEFLSDLLSRYCGVYSRIGSPDFNGHSIDRIRKEVDL